MNTVRTAVIGAGLIGKKHAELVTASDKCSLAGICDVDPHRRRAADEMGVPFYQDIEKLLQRERAAVRP